MLEPFAEALAHLVKTYLDLDDRDLGSIAADLRCEADGIDAMVAEEAGD